MTGYFEGLYLNDQDFISVVKESFRSRSAKVKDQDQDLAANGKGE